MSIHSRIKERRELLFKSHSAFSMALQEKHGIKVSWQAVQQWENGGSAPTRARMPAVADLLEVTPEWLLLGPKGEGSPDRVDDPPLLTEPPPWCAPEAFQLLNLYYGCDKRGRDAIFVYAEEIFAAAKKRMARNNS